MCDVKSSLGNVKASTLCSSLGTKQSWTLFKAYNSELPLVQEPVASTGEKSPPPAQIRETAARQERTDTRASYMRNSRIVMILMMIAYNSLSESSQNRTFNRTYVQLYGDAGAILPLRACAPPGAFEWPPIPRR
jgi:hypothetical protein